MRNPIRLKNLNLRFLPYYAIGLAVLVLHRPSMESLWAGAPLLLLGAALRTWGAGHLVKNDDLTMTGPYAHLRHPLYLGTILIGTGFAIGIGGLLGLLVVAVLWPWFAFGYFPRKERVESGRLEARYGDRFTAYRTAVPALWPRWSRFAGAEEADATAGRGDPTRWSLARYSDNNELGTLLAVIGGFGVFFLRASFAP